MDTVPERSDTVQAWSLHYNAKQCQLSRRKRAQAATHCSIVSRFPSDWRIYSGHDLAVHG